MAAGSLLKAVVMAYDGLSHTATVRAQGSAQAYLSGVVVAADIPAGAVLPGRRAVVVQFDRYHPGEAVLIAVY